MKNQSKTIMNKVFILISFIFICFYSNSNAQVSLGFQCEEDAKIINNKLIEQTPFIYKSETAGEEVSYIANSLYFVKNSDTLECYSYEDGTNCLESVNKFKYKNTNVYIVDFYEELVGYSYCIIVREDLLEFFITDIYNLNEELYQLDYSSIDFSNNSITTLRNKDTNIKKQISFKPIRLERYLDNVLD